MNLCYLASEWQFKNIEVEFLKVSEKMWYQDFQILELGSPGTSWFWQLVQALAGGGEWLNLCKLEVQDFLALIFGSHRAIFGSLWLTDFP